MTKKQKQKQIQFINLKVNDTVFVMHSNNNLERKTIKDISSHGGMIGFSLTGSDITVKAKARESICFDKKADVTIFTEQHNLKMEK